MRKRWLTGLLCCFLFSSPTVLACQEHQAGEYTLLNMRQVQVMLESYARYHAGQYPPSIQLLVQDAQQRKYYRHVTNPYSWKTNREKTGRVAFLTGMPQGPKWKGAVGYVPVYQSKQIKGYRLYGGDQNGWPLLAGEQPLVIEVRQR